MLTYSNDGEDFSAVLEDELSAHVDTQYFVFDTPPHDARFVRLVPLSDSSPEGTSAGIIIGEFRVFAEPQAGLPDEFGLNIADPKRGGHIVHSKPQQNLGKLLQKNNTGTGFSRPRGGWKEPAEFVIGFRDSRAAQIAALMFTEGKKRTSTISSISVDSSVDTALGPWQTIVENWQINPDAGGAKFDFEQGGLGSLSALSGSAADVRQVVVTGFTPGYRTGCG